MSTAFTYITNEEFEQLYIQLREKEGRVYPDDEVAKLPEIKNTHPYYKEWEIRKRSAKKIITYLKHKGDELDILEVGCGNGWLSAQLAAITKGKVIGIDVNAAELQQAQRVFHKIPNLTYVQCSLDSDFLQDKKFDIILFAASIQYFPSLKKTISVAATHMTLQGEIHIIDSHFYNQNEIAAAKQRTEDYFTALGFEDMAPFYFHHSLDDLKKFNYNIFYNPSAWFNSLGRNKNPFYHVIIKNRYQ